MERGGIGCSSDWGDILHAAACGAGCQPAFSPAGWQPAPQPTAESSSMIPIACIEYGNPPDFQRDLAGAEPGEDMRTLITGGAGFVGSHLCERFLSMGHEVVCVDNLITGGLGNVEHLRNHTG